MMNEDRRRFRVWYCDQEVRIFDGAEVIINQNGDIRALHLNNNAPDEWCDTTNLDVEACTGLKDKNGKLIYEGDIVQSRFNGIGRIVYYHAALVVAWKNEVCFYGHETRSTPIPLDVENIEIIGNIHKNPELLK